MTPRTPRALDGRAGTPRDRGQQRFRSFGHFFVKGDGHLFQFQRRVQRLHQIHALREGEVDGMLLQVQSIEGVACLQGIGHRLLIGAHDLGLVPLAAARIPLERRAMIGKAGGQLIIEAGRLVLQSLTEADDRRRGDLLCHARTTSG